MLNVCGAQEASIRGGLPPDVLGEKVIELRRQTWPFDLLSTPELIKDAH